jgi:hypothetical protein
MAAQKSREANDFSEASVKVLFLDIDGVVNNKRTEKNFESSWLSTPPPVLRRAKLTNAAWLRLKQTGLIPGKGQFR